MTHKPIQRVLRAIEIIAFASKMLGQAVALGAAMCVVFGFGELLCVLAGVG